MAVAFDMINAAMRAFDHILGNRLALLGTCIILAVCLLACLVRTFATEKLRPLPDDNGDKGSKQNLRQAQHFGS
jgi:hypothetical protein